MTLLTAFAVGGATMLGGVLGYFLKYRNVRAEGAVFAFAAGIMTAASFAELILPPTAQADAPMFFVCLASLSAGGALIRGLQALLTALQNERGFPGLLPSGEGKDRAAAALAFVAAIAIHNLPEGVAAGVGVGTGELGRAFTVAAGIALQNVPEGMIVIPPLVRAGVPRKKALLVSVLTGVIEIAGTVAGWAAASLSASVLPVLLCLAGGTMLYIISTEVLEDATRMAGKRLTGYSFLLGCCAMLAMERLF